MDTSQASFFLEKEAEWVASYDVLYYEVITVLHSISSCG